MAPISPPKSNESVYNKHITTLLGWVTHASRITRLTEFELLIFVVFVMTLVLGKLINVVAPQEEIQNYFNNKRNIFNVVFAKNGWAWTTLLIGIFQTFNYRTSAAPNLSSIRSNLSPQQRSSELVKFAVRYTLVTVWWIFFTQWFFGYPIMDKIFLHTGGKCVNITQKKLSDFTGANPNHSFDFQVMERAIDAGVKAVEEEIFESALGSVVCRRMGGKMTGGHDPSGHVFLLVHSSLFLLFETLHLTNFDQLARNSRKFKNALFSSDETPKDGKWDVQKYVSVIGTFMAENPVVAVWALCGLWWWMLLMTAVYFHSWLEKLVGLLWGYLGIFGVYVLPRFYHNPAVTRAKPN
ncbi:hypothetical protein BABINDRAFT_162117 [Babjeviella inositovora NRRL Y-12698]|uniref:Acyl-coenzyme A diphosphatase SCS3 n=1 Tax=Babjeviella inositovora NRRL Y-12698 TaxID=984486 RepID=A0A1E3QMY2_9ASCO|nr:uncharacterized protein BABINDRAFT_162117 [Babjeviella inositovora NRRL Y-12698]ODQ79045.1 hypothetical protein BABINDRAFT_162117 [Babjeviella inositovora NRRL Y-12698]